jgi:hypothetical protein
MVRFRTRRSRRPPHGHCDRSRTKMLVRLNREWHLVARFLWLAEDCFHQRRHRHGASLEECSRPLSAHAHRRGGRPGDRPCDDNGTLRQSRSSGIGHANRPPGHAQASAGFRRPSPEGISRREGRRSLSEAGAFPIQATRLPSPRDAGDKRLQMLRQSLAASQALARARAVSLGMTAAILRPEMHSGPLEASICGGCGSPRR